MAVLNQPYRKKPTQFETFTKTVEGLSKQKTPQQRALEGIHKGVISAREGAAESAEKRTSELPQITSKLSEGVKSAASTALAGIAAPSGGIQPFTPGTIDAAHSVTKAGDLISTDEAVRQASRGQADYQTQVQGVADTQKKAIEEGLSQAAEKGKEAIQKGVSMYDELRGISGQTSGRTIGDIGELNILEQQAVQESEALAGTPGTTNIPALMALQGLSYDPRMVALGSQLYHAELQKMRGTAADLMGKEERARKAQTFQKEQFFDVLGKEKDKFSKSATEGDLSKALTGLEEARKTELGKGVVDVSSAMKASGDAIQAAAKAAVEGQTKSFAQNISQAGNNLKLLDAEEVARDPDAGQREVDEINKQISAIVNATEEVKKKFGETDPRVELIQKEFNPVYDKLQQMLTTASDRTNREKAALGDEKAAIDYMYNNVVNDIDRYKKDIKNLADDPNFEETSRLIQKSINERIANLKTLKDMYDNFTQRYTDTHIRAKNILTNYDRVKQEILDMQAALDAQKSQKVAQVPKKTESPVTQWLESVLKLPAKIEEVPDQVMESVFNPTPDSVGGTMGAATREVWDAMTGAAGRQISGLVMDPLDRAKHNVETLTGKGKSASERLEALGGLADPFGIQSTIIKGITKIFTAEDRTKDTGEGAVETAAAKARKALEDEALLVAIEQTAAEQQQAQQQIAHAQTDTSLSKGIGALLGGGPSFVPRGAENTPVVLEAMKSLAQVGGAEAVPPELREHPEIKKALHVHAERTGLGTSVSPYIEDIFRAADTHYNIHDFDQFARKVNDLTNYETDILKQIEKYPPNTLEWSALAGAFRRVRDRREAVKTERRGLELYQKRLARGI